jgi:hypothetical protein
MAVLKELLSGSKVEVGYVVLAPWIASASCSYFIQKADKVGTENYELVESLKIASSQKVAGWTVNCFDEDGCVSNFPRAQVELCPEQPSRDFNYRAFLYLLEWVS